MINGKKEQIIQKTTIDQAIEKMLGSIGKPHLCTPNLSFKKSNVLKRENPSYLQSSADNLPLSIRQENIIPYEQTTI